MAEKTTNLPKGTQVNTNSIKDTHIGVFEGHYGPILCTINHNEDLGNIEGECREKSRFWKSIETVYSFKVDKDDPSDAVCPNIPTKTTTLRMDWFGKSYDIPFSFVMKSPTGVLHAMAESEMLLKG